MFPLQTSQPTRPIAALVGVFCFAAVAATVAAYLLDGDARTWAINCGWLAAAVASVTALAAARGRAAPAARSGWTLLLLGASLWAFGQVWWTVAIVVDLPPSPNLADLGWYGFAMFTCFGLLRLQPSARRARSLAVAEIVPLIAAVCALVAALVWVKVEDSPLAAVGIVSALAYPVLYVSAALIVLQSVTSGGLRVLDNPGAAAMVAGVAIEGIGFILWCPALLDGTYVAGAGLCDLLWTLGLVLLAVGACFAGPLAAAVTPHQRWAAVLPGVTLVALVGAQMHFILTDATVGPRLTLASAVAVVGVTLLVRSAILRREQVQLLERERQASAEAAATRKEFDGFFTLSIGLLGVAGFDGRFRRLNPAWTETLGWTVEELMATPFLDFVHPEDVERTARETQTLAEGEETFSFENRYRCKDGSYRWLAWKSRPDMGAGVIYATAHDVTDLRRVSTEVAVARDQALEASRQKSEFLAMMSHEIRTPLNGVIGMTNVLAGTALDAEQRAYAETIGSSGEALLTIINDILDFSKIEAGRLDLDPVDFEVRATVEEVGEQFAGRAHAKGLELVIDVGDSVPRVVHGDPGRLRQILTNLVGNAVKFTAAGEILVSVGPQRDEQGELHLRFEVRDSGVGIDPDDLPRLFESFTQADSSTTRRYGGSGLGLAISQQLTERMGGKIGATSAPGIGSTFWFTVRVAEVGDRAPAEPRLDLAGVRVLVVDDNATNREILEHQLHASRMRPETAEDGPSALRRLRAAARRGEPHELVLLDFNMPGMDGIELAQLVSADPELAGIPMIMLTSSGGHVEDGRRAGIGLFLTKPVRQSLLFDGIAQLLGGELEVPPAADQAAAPGVGAAITTGPRVLVAEDNEVNQAVATITLRKRGFEVDIAPDGAAAVAMAASGAYAAIFMDCQMPQLDGYDATREIRRREGHGRRVPIIAMTASAMRGDREHCLAAGMDDYLTKPLRLDKLDRALDDWVRGASHEHAAAPALDGDRIDVLREVLGDDEGLAEIFGLFCTDAADRLADLSGALEAGDADAARRAAHTLKASSANVGATEVSRLAELAERHATDGRLTEARADAAHLNDAVPRAVAGLLARLATPA